MATGFEQIQVSCFLMFQAFMLRYTNNVLTPNQQINLIYHILPYENLIFLEWAIMCKETHIIKIALKCLSNNYLPLYFILREQ